MSTDQLFKRHNLKHVLSIINDSEPFVNCYQIDPNDEVFNKPLKQ